MCRFTRLAALCALVLTAALLIACGDDDGPGQATGEAGAAEDLSPQGPPRPFAMGFSAFPAETTTDAYAETFELAGKYGEVILIQRPVPWDDFLPGDTSPSDELRDLTQLETGLARQHDLQIALAIDPTDPKNRYGLAPLPEQLRGMNFGNDELRTAYLAYVRYVAANYRPAYLALAVDINLLAGGNPSEFERFLPVYEQAYDIVKDVSPQTRVFATFQYEDLLGEMPWNPHQPDWELLERFGDKLDLFAISTYPSLLDQPIQDIPSNYYTQLRDHTDLPVAVIDMGYSSGPGAEGVNSGAEGEQARFLVQVLSAADQLDMPFVIWFAAADPSYVLEPPLDAYATIGLLGTDGEAKAAWSIWTEAFRRPYGDEAPQDSRPAPVRRNPIGTPPPSDEEQRPAGGDERDPFSSAPTPSATTPEDDEPAPSGPPGRTPTPIG